MCEKRVYGVLLGTKQELRIGYVTELGSGVWFLDTCSPAACA